MPLVDHLRELRRRIVIIVLAIGIATIIGWMVFDPVFEVLKAPYIDGVAPLALVLGIVLASPVWIGQIWGFILPALHRGERRWVYLLTATGAPLFAGGVVVGYLVMPKGVQVLIGMTPDSIQLLLTLGDYLNFVIRTVLVFGVAAEIPLVVVLLNRLGIVSANRLRAARPWTIIGIFIFAAVATPSTDPLTMLFLAVPMTILYLVSEIIASLTDRKRKRSADAEVIPDDQISELDTVHDPDDDRPSTL